MAEIIEDASNEWSGSFRCLVQRLMDQLREFSSEMLIEDMKPSGVHVLDDPVHGALQMLEVVKGARRDFRVLIIPHPPKR